MKNTTFKTIGDFQRLKESLNDVIDKRITKMKLEECINSFNSLSFACLNDIFKNTVDKLYETREGKRLIKKYVKTITGKSPGKSYSQLMKELLDVFTNIDARVINDLSPLFFNLW